MLRPRIALIGNGNVGKALATGLRTRGYEVTAVGNDAPLVRRAAEAANVVFLAVPYPARRDAVRAAGNLYGKTLVDVTNAVTSDSAFAGSARKSGAEEIQEWIPAARVVKAFNTVFARHMAYGRIGREHLSLLAASDNTRACEQVLEIGADLGFEPVDAGPLQNARWLEALGFLTIQLGYAQKLGTDIGFRVAGAPAWRRRVPVSVV